MPNGKDIAMASFKVGDVVQLKSGGPHMTVIEAKDIEGTPHVICSWFDHTKQEGGAFPADAVQVPLRKATATRGGRGGGSGSWLGN
jgi:uncharacterized protein YodC (DUF2158 family)